MIFREVNTEVTGETYYLTSDIFGKETDIFCNLESVCEDINNGILFHMIYPKFEYDYRRSTDDRPYMMTYDLDRIPNSHLRKIHIPNQKLNDIDNIVAGYPKDSVILVSPGSYKYRYLYSTNSSSDYEIVWVTYILILTEEGVYYHPYFDPQDPTLLPVLDKVNLSRFYVASKDDTIYRDLYNKLIDKLKCRLCNLGGSLVEINQFMEDFGYTVNTDLVEKVKENGKCTGNTYSLEDNDFLMSYNKKANCVSIVFFSTDLDEISGVYRKGKNSSNDLSGVYKQFDPDYSVKVYYDISMNEDNSSIKFFITDKEDDDVKYIQIYNKDIVDAFLKIR